MDLLNGDGRGLTKVDHEIETFCNQRRARSLSHCDIPAMALEFVTLLQRSIPRFWMEFMLGNNRTDQMVAAHHRLQVPSAQASGEETATGALAQEFNV